MRRVDVLPYDVRWRSKFEEEALKLRETFCTIESKAMEWYRLYTVFVCSYRKRIKKDWEMSGMFIYKIDDDISLQLFNVIDAGGTLDDNRK